MQYFAAHLAPAEGRLEKQARRCHPAAASFCGETLMGRRCQTPHLEHCFAWGITIATMAATDTRGTCGSNISRHEIWQDSDNVYINNMTSWRLRMPCREPLPQCLSPTISELRSILKEVEQGTCQGPCCPSDSAARKLSRPARRLP